MRRRGRTLQMWQIPFVHPKFLFPVSPPLTRPAPPLIEYVSCLWGTARFLQLKALPCRDSQPSSFDRLFVLLRYRRMLLGQSHLWHHGTRLLCQRKKISAPGSWLWMRLWLRLQESRFSLCKKRWGNYNVFILSILWKMLLLKKHQGNDWNVCRISSSIIFPVETNSINVFGVNFLFTSHSLLRTTLLVGYLLLCEVFSAPIIALSWISYEKISVNYKSPGHIFRLKGCLRSLILL